MAYNIDNPLVPLYLVGYTTKTNDGVGNLAHYYEPYFGRESRL